MVMLQLRIEVYCGTTGQNDTDSVGYQAAGETKRLRINGNLQCSALGNLPVVGPDPFKATDRSLDFGLAAKFPGPIVSVGRGGSRRCGQREGPRCCLSGRRQADCRMTWWGPRAARQVPGKEGRIAAIPPCLSSRQILPRLSRRRSGLPKAVVC